MNDMGKYQQVRHPELTGVVDYKSPKEDNKEVEREYQRPKKGMEQANTRKDKTKVP